MYYLFLRAQLKSPWISLLMSITFVCIHFVQAIDNIGEFRDRVFAVALTDSVHSFSHQYADDSVIDFYRQVRNTDDSVLLTSID